MTESLNPSRIMVHCRDYHCHGQHTIRFRDHFVGEVGCDWVWVHDGTNDHGLNTWHMIPRCDILGPAYP